MTDKANYNEETKERILIESKIEIRAEATIACSFCRGGYHLINCVPTKEWAMRIDLARDYIQEGWSKKTIDGVDGVACPDCATKTIKQIKRLMAKDAKMYG